MSNDSLNPITHHDPETIAFIRESNRIEGIRRDPTEAEIEEHCRFMAQDDITLQDMVQFVSIYQPGAELRERKGMNVRIGHYYPPHGDITIRAWLQDIVEIANRNKGNPRTAYQVHLKYESLHPFMDGNGRSGRMLWLWMMREAPLGFLHTFYYQTLDASGR
jgi:hypothetical protein